MTNKLLEANDPVPRQPNTDYIICKSIDVIVDFDFQVARKKKKKEKMHLESRRRESEQGQCQKKKKEKKTSKTSIYIDRDKRNSRIATDRISNDEAQ